MQNIEKLINLQRRFEKDIRFFVDKEDYVSFEKVIEDFIIEAGKLNPDINTRDLLSRHLSKAGKVKSYSDALQIINSVSSDITLLSMDLHGKGEPIYTMVELDKLKRDNNIEFTKNSFDIFKKSFDLLKKNNSDRFSKIDDLRSLYLGNVKNYKDKVFKFPHLVDTEQRKLFNTLKDNITKQVFDTFEKDREILLSYLSEIAEIGKAYVDRNVDYSDRFLDGYNIQKRREIIGESVDTEKLRKDLDKSNEKNIDSLIDSIKKCFDSYIKGVENLMTEHSKLYNDRIERTRAERVILGGQDEIKGIIERYKKQLEDIITSELSKDEEVFYSILGELKNSVNESDGDTNLYEVSGEFEYNIKYNFGRLRDDVLDDFDLMKKKQIDLQKEHLQKILNGENVNQDISKEIMDIIKDYEYKTESLYKRFIDDIQVDCENFIENLYDIYTGNVDKNKAKDFAKRFVSKGLSDVQEIERNLIYKTNMEMKKVSMESYKNLISKPFTKRDIDTHIGELISFYEDRRERTEGFFDLGWKKVKKTSENFINEFGLDVVYLNENHLNEDKESLEKINDVFDTFKGEVNELLKDFEDDMKDNFEDEFKKLMEKLDGRFHDIMSSDDYVAFDKEEKVISSMFIDFCDELNIVVAGCLNAFKSNCINASNRFKAGMRGVRSLTDREIAEQGIKRFIDSTQIMVKNIERSKSFSKEYEKKYRRNFEEIISNHIWNGDMQFASGSEKLEKHLRNLLFKDDIFSMGVTSDILKNIALSVNGVDISKDKLLTRVKSVDLVRESKQRLLDKVERYGESYKEVAEHSILPIFYNLRNDAKSITDPSTLKKNFISYTEKAENGGTYSKFLESYKKDILSAVDSFCKDFIKITDTKVDSEQRNFESKVNDILKEYSDIFPYGTEYYFDQEIKDKLSDIKDHNTSIIEECHEAYGKELSDMVFPEVIHEDIKKEIENLISKLNSFINENNDDIIITEPVFESRLDRNDILSIINHGTKSMNESSSSERAEKLIKRLIKDFSIEGKEEKYYPGYHFLDKMEFEFDQIGFKIKNHIEDGNADKLQRDIPGLVDISAGLMERKYIDVIYERKEEIHKEIDKAVEEYNKILGSKDNLMKGIAFRSKYEIDSLVNDSINKVKNEFKKIRTSLSTDLKQMYTEDSTLENIKKYQDSRNHHLWVDGVVERMERFILDLLNKTLVPKIREIFNELNFEFGISPAQVRDDITNWWRKIEFGNKLILKKYLRSGMGDQFDLFIKRKYRRLKPNEIGLSQVIEFVKGEYEAYSMEFNNMVVEILNGYDVTYSRYSKFKDISDTARKLAKDFQREKWVYRSFFVKHNNMIEECIEDFLSAYQKGDYHNERWSYPYDDWYKDRNFYRVVEVELSNAYYRSVKDHEISGRGRYKGYSTVMDESDSISESRRDTFFEAEEEKKPKISKEEKEKLKAQLDNFFADKKEAKATELKKSIADRDKAIEDVILKYSTEKENIQREYSKNIQASKSEAEANKLRAERDEELQRLSLEKATSIEDLKERQKKEEASIREKYQSLFDKKLEEYKDSLGDAIGDFAKDIERGIEDGIRKNPIFQ